ncbi:hypothetical protein DBW39_004447 [Escherichia coli]|nr:hypothetical protein [Escherichia coli]
MTQHIVSSAAESGTTCCDDGRWRCVGGEEDPEPPETGSARQKRRKQYDNKNTHKIISDMIFIIDEKTIPDIIINQEHTNHA